jgi:hypothetical protein
MNNARHDFGSILRFAEHKFGIPEGALNFADQRATTNLAEFFNLSQLPRTFKVIPAPLGEKFFLNDKRPLWNLLILTEGWNLMWWPLP